MRQPGATLPMGLGDIVNQRTSLTIIAVCHVVALAVGATIYFRPASEPGEPPPIVKVTPPSKKDIALRREHIAIVREYAIGFGHLPSARDLDYAVTMSHRIEQRGVVSGDLVRKSMGKYFDIIADRSRTADDWEEEASQVANRYLQRLRKEEARVAEEARMAKEARKSTEFGAVSDQIPDSRSNDPRVRFLNSMLEPTISIDDELKIPKPEPLPLPQAD